jgi:hypothetical protein
MNQRHKHYDVIHAWAEGEKIESRLNAECEWGENTNPSWNEGIEYRIKPKTVKKEGWVNVYKGSLLTVHTVKHCADNANILGKEKIACIRIEWDEEE